MKLLTGILAIIWFLGWGFWFLFERGHLEFSTTTTEEIISESEADTVMQWAEEEMQHSFLQDYPPKDSVDVIIDSLMAQRGPGETVHVTSYYSEKEPYSGNLGNLGIERSVRLIENARKRYAGRILQPIGLVLKTGEDTTGVSQFYSVEKIDKNSPIKILDTRRVLLFFPFSPDNDLNNSKISQALDSLSSIWRLYGNRLFITGYTDNTANETMNYNLGLEKAKSIQEKIVANGFPAEKITTLSRGEKEPISINTTNDGRYLNRRVEIILDK